ncbi:LCP family protein, partial [Mycobacterium sp. SMC-4]|uniref:LCP family protein n=1 Tax=Mycobacterium sp. SMC-4 TaxID=2857059 RepID=UPI003D057108
PRPQPPRRQPPRPQPPRQQPPRPQPAGPQRRRRRRWPHVILAMLLVLVTATVAAAVWIDLSLQRVTALTDYPGRPATGAGTTWLLVGSDSRSDLTPEEQAALTTGGDLGASRTDTILLVHLPGLGASVPPTVVSIPRDSYVEIPGYGSDKINAAFSLGGAALLTQTVEQATGLRIDRYAEIGFGGFARLVDAVGGVTICPAEPINDPLAGIDLAAGCQHVDGATALGFVRSRATPRADLDRMVNQRRFVSTLVQRAASPTVFLNPLRWYPMVRAVADTLTVGQGEHVWNLARLAWTLRGDVTTVTVPIGEFSVNGSGAIVVWDEQAAAALFTALAQDIELPQSVLDAGP